MFSTHPTTNFNFSVTFILSSANAVTSDQSIKLSFGKDLICFPQISVCTKEPFTGKVTHGMMAVPISVHVWMRAVDCTAVLRGKLWYHFISPFTHYHLIPHFDELKIYNCGKDCKKRRNCNFSFSHNVFYPKWY